MGMKFIDLVGQTFDEWTVQERVRVARVSLWKCVCSCGTIKDVYGQNLRDGKSKSCGGVAHISSESREKAAEEFIKNATLKHAGAYDYSTVDYFNSQTAVEIICKSCSTKFSQRPNGHLGGSGCVACYKVTKLRIPKVNLSGMQFGQLTVGDYGNGAWGCTCTCGAKPQVKSAQLTNGKSQSCGCSGRYTKDVFIATAEALHPGKYDYSGIAFENFNIPVRIRCKYHNTFFTQKPAKHLTGQGCKKCGRLSTAQLQSSTTSEFTKKAVAVHFEKYDYKHVEYKTAEYKVSIQCNTCSSVFLQSPNAHLSGKGCVSCAKFGFDTNRSASLYVLTCGDMTKVGITNKTAGTRAMQVGKSFGAEFKVLKEFSFEDGQRCSDIETKLLRTLRSKYSNPICKFDGYSEVFLCVDQKWLFEQIKMLGVEFA